LITSRNILVSVSILNSAIYLLSNMLTSYVSCCEIAGGPWLIECEVETSQQGIKLNRRSGDAPSPQEPFTRPPRATISNSGEFPRIPSHEVHTPNVCATSQHSLHRYQSICQATCTPPAVHHSTTAPPPAAKSHLHVLHTPTPTHSSHSTHSTPRHHHPGASPYRWLGTLPLNNSARALSLSLSLSLSPSAHPSPRSRSLSPDPAPTLHRSPHTARQQNDRNPPPSQTNPLYYRSRTAARVTLHYTTLHHTPLRSTTRAVPLRRRSLQNP
jgi:hypothetical protein